MNTTFTQINAGSYPVFVGGNIFSELDLFFGTNKFSSLFILVDENSASHCLPVFVSKTENLGNALVIKIESGEQHKNINTCASIWKKLGECGADRKSLLVNMGGGVIGDMGGFAASTYKRGISFINIPTTLLSQVDASIGGKLGIDFNNLKNEIGIFNDPIAVFIYPPLLKTLDSRQQLSGFAEIIKHALIADELYWKQIKATSPYKIDEKWEQIIAHSVSIKNKIVRADPKEQNIRKALNFGHTIGHAIESYFLEQGKGSLLHGEAIAIGMICESFLSHSHCGLPVSQLDEINDFIFSHYRKISIEEIDRSYLLRLMQHDKKNEAGIINFTLLKKIGEYSINVICSIENINKALDFYMKKS